MKTILAILVLSLTGCETMRISGSIGYVDPESGAKGGLTIGDTGSGWWIKVPIPASNNTKGGTFIVEGDLPQVDRKSGK